VREGCFLASTEIYKVQHHTADRSSTNVHRWNSQGSDHYYSLCLVLWGPAYSAQHYRRFRHYMRYAEYSHVKFSMNLTLSAQQASFFSHTTSIEDPSNQRSLWTVTATQSLPMMAFKKVMSKEGNLLNLGKLCLLHQIHVRATILKR
jgi:hypothetical protein